MRRRTEMIMITFVKFMMMMMRIRRRLTRLSSASSCLLRDLVGERLGEREADLGDIVTCHHSHQEGDIYPYKALSWRRAWLPWDLLVMDGKNLKSWEKSFPPVWSDWKDQLIVVKVEVVPVVNNQHQWQKVTPTNVNGNVDENYDNTTWKPTCAP